MSLIVEQVIFCIDKPLAAPLQEFNKIEQKACFCDIFAEQIRKPIQSNITGKLLTFFVQTVSLLGPKLVSKFKFHSANMILFTVSLND